MGDISKIEWTDSTWNPVTGCSHVSSGCEHCYAETLSRRYGWSRKAWTAPNAAENVVLHPERLEQPLHWAKPRRVFVNSMSDLYHERVPLEFLDRVWRVMLAATRHTYQILTKRPDLMVERTRAVYGRIFNDRDMIEHRVPEHIWLGVSIEQDRWCSRADLLRTIPAAVRFISAEPLLEPLPSLNLDGIHWLIVGGESGPRYRHFDPAWARLLREKARKSHTAFFFKQYGGPTSKSGGRLLDGRTWDEQPTISG